jgi:hypothetical protein
MRQIGDRLFTYKWHQIKNVDASYDNHLAIQEIPNGIAFNSQSLSDFSLEELGLPQNTHCVAFPECGLPFLLMLQSQGKI